MSEQKDLIEEVIEPYLLQIGFLIRTSRGRCLTKLGWEYLNLSPSNDKVEQLNFLNKINHITIYEKFFSKVLKIYLKLTYSP